ncbi:MAG: A/G-specific adenine glycosylase [Deltaproteobacteria bacterium]|nr:A/G-specific adenine glycosylase [Deltaproteobacteria bacterium]
MFGGDLVAWFDAVQRDLPWRRHRSAYTTWVSEVMLQQTTVDVVAPRYAGFLDRFPDVTSLAAASEDDVVAAWAGLGYYRRARGLKRGAEEVVARHDGEIPSALDALLALPGVGPYTAGAIRSLAFNEPAAAVDGNVARVASRLFEIDEDSGRTVVRRRMGERLVEATPIGAAASFNEALIELGAVVCRPKDPACEDCPIESHCGARESGRVHELPKTRPPRKSVAVMSHRALVERGGRVLMVRRPADASLLPGQWELPGRWGPIDEDQASALREVLLDVGLDVVGTAGVAAEVRHSITHHRIRSILHRVAVSGRVAAPAKWFLRDGLDLSCVTTETRKLLARAEVRS